MASDQGGKFLDEEAAVRAVLAAVEDGLERMHAVHNRMLARRPGGRLTPQDLRWLQETEGALADMASTAADKGIKGPYGKLLEEAFRKGAKSAGNTMIGIDPKTIAAALKPAQLKIKDLLEDGSRSITELTSKAMVAEWSPRELSERIQAEVVLYDQDGSPYGVPAWRAELQARNEPMKVYRETASKDWGPDTLLEQIGPDDARTAGDICSRYNGRVMTLAAWEKAGCDPRGYAWHPNCRHRWVKAQEGLAADSQAAKSKLSSPPVGGHPTLWMPASRDSLVRPGPLKNVAEIEQFLKSEMNVAKTSVHVRELLESVSTAFNTTKVRYGIELPPLEDIVRRRGDWRYLDGPNALAIGTVAPDAWDVPTAIDLLTRRPGALSGMRDGAYVPGLYAGGSVESFALHEIAHLLHAHPAFDARERMRIMDSIGVDPSVLHNGNPVLEIDAKRDARRVSIYATNNYAEALAESFLCGTVYGWDHVPERFKGAWGSILKYYGGRLK